MPERNEDRARATTLFKQQNYAEAYTLYRGLTLQDGPVDILRGSDFSQAVNCLNQLNRIHEFDALANSALKLHNTDWRFHQHVAELFLGGEVTSNGYLIGGEFLRGGHRGGGKQANSRKRDRVRALKLMVNAEALMNADVNATAKDRFQFYDSMGDLVVSMAHQDSWRLQELTDLTELPDVEGGADHHFGGFLPGIRGRRGMGGNGLFSVPAQFGGFPFRADEGAPVDDEGNPVFYRIPDSWEAAKNDGERWRWLMARAVEEDPSRASEVELKWATFLQQEFGVIYVASPVAGAIDGDSGSENRAELQAWILHELADTETVAKLATGPKRLTLPDEFNHIRILQRIAERNDDVLEDALEQLYQIRMSRHQYPRAAKLTQRQLEVAKSADQRKAFAKQKQQLEGNWVSFQQADVQLAGRKASLGIRYRNGKSVEFTAHEIKVEELLRDVMSYLESGPGQIENQKLQIERIGYRLVNGGDGRYIGEQVAGWTEDLQPPEQHFDAEKVVTTPLNKAGAYLLKGKMESGNEQRIIIWIKDTELVRKRVEKGTMYLVADSRTGAAIPRASLEFFGFTTQRVANTRRYTTTTSKFADRTDDNGICIPNIPDKGNRLRWLTIARTDDGRFAYDGFDSVWRPREIQSRDMAATKVYTITDRPVYRPGHTVEYRMWIRQPRFLSDEARYAGQKLYLQFRNPRRDVILEKEVELDRWGGVDGSLELADDVMLGRYRIAIGEKRPQTRTRVVNGERKQQTVMRFREFGSGGFSVEEYRKPEYKVTVNAPEDPVQLGEKITATVDARYFFGAPVTDATVKYKVNRTKKDARWFPVARWDWLYAPGYWWFAPDYSWYPGWSQWGCFAPRPRWRGWSPDPPETVVEGESPIGADGTLSIEIDTATALEQHSDSDHNYSISVEVVDRSRRTIIGTGNVLVARDPFKVFVWPDKGFYRAGETINVGFRARTPDGKPVAGNGTLRLYSLSYKDNQPQEKLVEDWSVATGDDGPGQQKIVVPNGGQFRLSVTIEDDAGNRREGGYLIYVRGDEGNGSDYRFNDLELITEKREYEPGETVSLQVSTDQPGSTVLLFVRPADGICPEPQVLRLEGKSTVIDVEVVRKDMPNFFVEALTVADGQVHSALKEIVVPPVRRIVNVDVLPSSENYRPGEEATVRLKLTGLHGEPVVGDTVLSVYDASLEYIAASSIPEIRSFFWNFRRRHSMSTSSASGQPMWPVAVPNEEVMQEFGFGNPAFEFGGGGGGLGGGVFGSDSFREPGSSMARGRAAPLAMPMAAGDAGMEMMSKTSAVNAGELDAEVEPSVRSNFADTAFWNVAAVADADGIVEVTFPIPDNLTTWKVKAWALSDGTRVGSGDTEIICSKDLIIRPQTPRFFTETDRMTVSAVVHNYLSTARQTRVSLETEGGQLNILDDSEQTVTIAADGETRIDWTVEVVGSGMATVKMSAKTNEESDATEFDVPCSVHGILKTESFTGVIRGERRSATVEINVPTKRIEEQSRLEVRYSPTLAGAMIDSLPYLLEYPYGCTEQTLNRFLPAVITQQTLIRMGVNLEDIKRKRTNLNSQESGDSSDRVASRPRDSANPVFDSADMQKIVTTGVTDLTNMQLSDGGWGWFSGYGETSTGHLTSQVVHGLTIARQNDVPVLPQVIEKGVSWLKEHQQNQIAKLKEAEWRKAHPDELENRKRPYKTSADHLDAFVAFVLCEHDSSDPAMHDYLYRDRGGLSVYAKALVGLVFDFQKDDTRRDLILRNIEQLLVTDDKNQTAYLEMGRNTWWYWYGSENEAMARYLQLLLRARPNDPTSPMLVKYLLNNRKHGTYWNSTRDTAMVVEALAEYIKATGEDQPDMTVEVYVDGHLRKKTRITPQNLFTFENVMLLEGDTVKTGEHRIEIRRTGSGPLYFNAYLTNFSREDHISATGLEVEVARRFFRLQPISKSGVVRGDRGQAVAQSTSEYERIPLRNLDDVQSGDLIEVELLVKSRNDYEYLLLEDRKPSGFETDDQRSGYFNNGLRTYRELRDDRVSFFLSRLARGSHSLSYRIRAESPGERLAALPAKIEGMYAPELVGNSEEFRVRVTDRPEIRN